MTKPSTDQLIACHECDLLQREAALPRGGLVRCWRCGAELYRSHPQGGERSLAFALAALAVMVIANAFPIVGLEINGELVQATLFGTVLALYESGMRPVAALVFVTTMATPMLVLLTMIYLMVPLRLGRVPPDFALIFRIFRFVAPWSMVEVFMLGILVALVKLAHIATVVPGIALWSFGFLILLFAAAIASFDPRALWAKRERLQ
jgi:paraquat-inducible protein A